MKNNLCEMCITHNCSECGEEEYDEIDNTELLVKEGKNIMIVFEAKNGNKTIINKLFDSTNTIQHLLNSKGGSTERTLLKTHRCILAGFKNIKKELSEENIEELAYR